jgi:replicative DNA helicase
MGEGRVPPHDLDAEQSVLGSIVLDPAAITRVIDILEPVDFYRENHGQVFRAAIELFRQGEPIDSITLASQLTQMGVLERIGGRAQLAMLAEAVPTAANIEYYARIVKSRAQKRRLISAGGHVTGLGFDDAIEADDALNQAQQAVFDIADQRVRTRLEELYPLLKAAMERVDAQMASGTGVLGVPSGWHDLDRLTSGFKDGDLVIIAARPSMGKTSMALNIALHAAVMHKVPTAVFSLEMSKEQLVERLLCQQARIDSQRLHRGLLSDREYEQLVGALQPLESAPIYIDESPVLDEVTMMLKARQAKAQLNIGLIVVDYLQLMKGHGGRDDNRVQEVSSISRALKAIARELKVPVLALSQLSRGPEARPNKRPMLSDLRDSGSIEQDSDLVIFLYRDDYYNDKSEEPGICEVIIAKHRNGPVGAVKLRFRKDQTLFYSLEQRRGPSAEEEE